MSIEIEINYENIEEELKLIELHYETFAKSKSIANYLDLPHDEIIQLLEEFKDDFIKETDMGIKELQRDEKGELLLTQEQFDLLILCCRTTSRTLKFKKELRWKLLM